MRRTWMLLLVTVLLAVFLAVPAMAADCEDCSGANHCHSCNSTHAHDPAEGWLSLNDVIAQYLVDHELTDFTRSSGYVYTGTYTDLLVDGGKYYLEEDLGENLMISTDLDITICLNGKTWHGTRTADGDAFNRRAFGTNKAGAVINIVDCSVQDENGVSAGEIQGGQAGIGGSIYVSNGAKVNFFNGTITGGNTTDTGGGNVYVTGTGSQFNMYGGVISNGRALDNATTDGTKNRGGNVYIVSGSAEFNMYGGTIIGGSALRGGNVFMASAENKFNLVKGVISNGLATGAKSRVGNFYVFGGTLTIGKKDVAEPDDLNASVQIIDGTAYHTDKTDVNCGNIWVTSGSTLNMYYGTISGGMAANTVGNIRLDGTMNMYGGVIKDGSIGTDRETSNYANSGANVIMNGTGAKLVMSGGHIFGYAQCNNGVAANSLQFSGSAKVYTEDNDNDGLSDGGFYAKSLPVLGKLNDDAKIAIQVLLKNSEGEYVAQSTITPHADSYSTIANDWAGYIQNRQLVGYGSKWLTWQAGDANGDGTVAKGEGIATYEAEDTTNKTRWYCVCGYNPFEEGGHIGDCEGYDYEWKRITSGSSLDTTGNYYLYLEDATPKGYDKDNNPVYSIEWKSLSGTDTTAVKTVRLDLNGYTLEQLTQGGRFLTFYSTTRTQGYDVVVTDSSQGHTARLGTWGAFIESRTPTTGSPQGRLFWLARTITRPDGETFGDTLSVYRLTMDASSCEAGQSTTSNGTTTKESWRGLIATVTGNSKAGFYNCNMVAGSTNNTAASNSKPTNGMAIRLENSKCSVNIVGGTIQSGSAVIGGGIGMTGGTLNIDGTTIYGGTVSSAGGAIHTQGGTLNISNATIYGGAATSTGGAMYLEATQVSIDNSRLIGGKTTNSSGGCIYAKSCTALDITNSVITNKTGEKNDDGTDKVVDLKSGTSGGAIYSNGCALTIENTTIEGATAGTNGGLILQLKGSLELKGCTLNGGVANSTTGGGGSIYAEDTTVTIDKYVNEDGKVATTQITGGEAVKYGGSMYVNRTTVDLKHGVISNGTCTSATGGGGNIYLTGNDTTAGVFNMGVENATVTDALNETVVVSGGETSGSNTHGGNFRIQANGQVNMHYGTIKEGKAHNQGGNLRMDGTFNMYNGVIKDGYTKNRTTYTEYTLNGNANANMMMTYGAEFNMSGGHIHGYVASYTDSTNMPAITLEKAAKIYHPTISGAGLTIEYAAEYKDAEGNLINDGNQILTIRDLTAAAKLVFIHSNAKDGNLLTTTPIDENCVLTGLYYGKNDYKLGLNADGNLYMMSAANATTGAVINGGDLVLTLPKAIELATGTNDFVRMLSDYTGEQLVISKSLNLDLAGKKLTNGLKLTGGTLKLADSANENYVDNSLADKNNNRLTIDNQGGTIERAFITGYFTNYGANHRYLVVKHQDGTYSAHRIYLAVKAPVLYPMKAAMSFKTVLGCDQTVADYINDGGQYGVYATGPAGSDSANYLAVEGVEVLPYSEQNAKTTALVNILDGTDDAGRAVEDLSAQAYMVLNDYFYEGGENKATTSAEKKANLKQLVQAANSMTLSNTQKVAVAQMYNTHINLMQDWGLDNIADYAEQVGLIERHCLCGDPTSTNNPCAAKGHAQLDWQPLPEAYYKENVTDATSQWKEGNYYLTDDIALEKQPTIVADNMVCLDLNGHSITDVTARLANVSGVFNIVNSQFHEDGTVSSVVCNSNSDGNGGLLIAGSGNVSLYKGVTVKAEEGHIIGRGLVETYGSLNIYGATIQGTTLAENNRGTDMYGGAVYVGSNGYLFINDGQIIAGNDNERGGAIYTAGGQTHIKGEAQITAPDGSRTESGGLIYMAGGEVNISGVALTGTDADYGAAITVTSGTLNLDGNPQVDGNNITYDTVINGGTAKKGGAIFISGENAKVNVNGAKISGGTANGYTTTTVENEVETTEYNTGAGGAVYVEGKAVLSLTNQSTIEGGHASLGGNLYVANSGTDVDIKDSFIRDGVAVREETYHMGGSGSNISIVGGTLKMTNTTVEGGDVSAFDNNSDESDGLPGKMYGGSVLYAGGGTTTIENCRLYGYREAKMWKHGGTIMNRGATINLTDSTITASWVETDASVLYNSGTFTMTDSVLDASLLSETTDTSITYAGAVRNSGTFIMNGDDSEIRGYKIGHTNGGGALYSSGGTVTMTGGTIHGGTASSTGVGGNVSIKGGSFTMSGGTIKGDTFVVNETEITGGVATGSSAKGGNLYVSGNNTDVILSGGTIEGGTVADGALGGNLYVASGTVNISDAVIGSETVPETVDAVTGGNIYMAGGTLNLGGTGVIRNGIASEKGGNLYIENGTFTMTGGTISNTAILADTDANYLYSGTHATMGGNIYMADGTLSMSGGTITGGVAKHGGNVYIADGTAEFSGGTIQSGFAVRLNNSSDGHGGNIYVAGSGELTLSGANVESGKATHMAGNIYSNGKIIMTGGLVTGGKEYNDSSKKFIDNTAVNLMIVNGNLEMTGGTINGGVTMNNNSRDWETHQTTMFLKVGGSAKILTASNNGLSLTSGVKTAETDTTPAVYYKPPKFDIDYAKTLVTEGENAAKIYITSVNHGEVLVERPKDENGAFTMTEEEWLTFRDVAENVFVYTGSTKMVTFEEDGVYLRSPATNTRYGCECGANAGEDHVNGCVGYDILWNKWNASTLPNVPGYWYLEYTDEVVEPSSTYFNRDFLQAADGSFVCKEGSTTPLGFASVVDANGNPTGDLKWHDGNNWLTYEKADTETLVESYDVHVDLNGHKVDGPDGGRVYSYLNTVNAAGAKRQAAANLTVIDSSVGHTGGMSTAGVYGTKDSFSTDSQPQGSLIWMPYETDSLTTCFVELNASSATHGRGHAVDTAGTVHFWNTDIMGGTAMSYERNGELVTSAKGGGAVSISSTGNVTMHGGTITGGKAVFDWIRTDFGERKTNVYGGANVYVDGGIFTMDGGTITGGETWIVNGTAVNDLIEYTPGVGGGVYMHGGEFHVKGDAKVYGNYYYTYTVNNNGTEDDLTDDTYVCEKIDANKKSSNVYLGSGAVYNDGLTSGAQIGIHKDVYDGIIAHTTSDCSAFLYRDDTDAQVTGAIFDGENGTLALGVAAYRVGYGMASIQPTDEDLVTGLSLNGYGNTAVRTTDKLYNLNGSLMDNLENSTKLNALKDFEAHSDLAATAVAITDAQGETVLLISVDMTSMGSDTANKAKNMIAMKTGVPKENIVISAGHQHSCPSASTIYYKNAEGQYTDANGTVLTADQDRVVKTDFARTFYHGVLDAAVQAVGDRKEATVTAGILDTTSGGDQYNFVRNKTVTVLKDYSYTYEKGTINYEADQTYNVTDNHYGIEKGLYEEICAACKVKETGGTPTAEQQALIDTFSVKYESEIDTTMQLVKFSQTGGKEIVLANFQTHPHKAGGSANYHVHSDVIGAFRYYLKQASGAEVIYFSGASGNVNTTGALDYQELSTDYDDFSFDWNQDFNAYKKMAKVAHYGDSLAALAYAFISADGNMTEVAGTRDVSVATSTVTYTVQEPNLSAEAIARINANVMHWNGGEDDGAYLDGYDPTSFQDNLWWEMVGQFRYDQPTEKVYSAYHASRAYKRYEAITLNGKSQGEISISAYNIGGIGFVQAPYEMFQESGQAIKGNVPGSTYVPENGATNPFAYTIIASQANAGHGYIATRVAYENGGGYSSTDNSLYAAGTAEALVNEYVNLLNGLHK